jgi:hypothetical protein
MMEDARLVIFFNKADAAEVTCPLCQRQFILPEGYTVFLQKAEEPAMTAQPVCQPCVLLEEPQLEQILDLHRSFAEFSTGMQIRDSAGQLNGPATNPLFNERN